MLFNRLVRDKISFHLAILLAIIAALTLSLLCSASYAKKLAVKSEAPTQFPAPFLAPVNFDNKTLFLVQARVLSFPPQERAKLIEERIKRLADNHLIQVDKITAFDGETTSDVIGGDLIIMSVTEEDAKAAGKKRSELAREYALILRNAIREQRQSYSMKAILTGIVLALLMTALFVLAAALLFYDLQQSPLWALSGNLVILVVALITASSSHWRVTGRQVNLPTIASTTDFVRGGRVGVPL